MTQPRLSSQVPLLTIRPRVTSPSTKGLRQKLSTTEMKAVLAHEMGHLRHRDVSRNMHIAIAAAGLGGVYEAGRFLLDSSRRRGDKSSGDKDEGSSAGIGLALMAGGFAAQAVAHLSQLAASRSSELQADLAAAEAFGADARGPAPERRRRPHGARDDLRRAQRHEGGQGKGGLLRAALGRAAHAPAHARARRGPRAD